MSNIKQSAYPDNLLEAIGIFEIIGTDEAHYQLTEDQVSGLDYVISLMRKRDQVALLCRYEDKLTYKEIGERLCITGTRAQQIIQRILRKMQDPSRCQYIIKGYEVHTQEIRKQQNLIAKRKYEDVFGKNENIRDMDIKIFQFPIRIWNVLNRNGIHTIGELENLFSPDVDISSCAIGKRCLKEAFAKLQEYGIIEY